MQMKFLHQKQIQSLLMTKNKHWTGERLETFVFNNATIEHLHRYAIALQLVRGKIVADIACGEGYGSNLMAGVAREVTGIDVSVETIEGAKEKYKNENLRFIHADATNSTLPGESVDIVVSFETIEHLSEHEAMMLEIKRILKPGGILLMSSPDKKYYTDIPNHINMFHIKELYFDEFKALIQKHFINADFFFQNTFKASVLIPEISKNNNIDICTGDFDEIDMKEGFIPLYNIVVASDNALPEINAGIFNGNDIDIANIKNQLGRLERQIMNIRNSKRYKLAGWLQKPADMVRKLKRNK
jgi:ubiquinone/menaquinone biosynthesis C-methylase UbiE